MKKIISVLLSLISVICIAFALGGCQLPTIKLFIVGTYETYEVEGVPFINAKFILQTISKEEFENANGINVIKNESTSKENNIYYSFELFLYDDTQCEYVQAKIYNLAHKSGRALNRYDGEIECQYYAGRFSFYYHGQRETFINNYGEAGSENNYIHWCFKLENN